VGDFGSVGPKDRLKRAGSLTIMLDRWNRSVTVRRLKNVDSGNDGRMKSNLRRLVVFVLGCAAIAAATVGMRVEKRLVHLSAKDGSTRWTTVVPADARIVRQIRPSWSVDGVRAKDALGLLIVTSPGKVTAVDASTGARKWSFTVPRTSVAIGELSGVVHSSENDQNRLTSFDLADGSQDWSKQTLIKDFVTLGISDRKGGPTALFFTRLASDVVEIHVVDDSGQTLRVIESDKKQDNPVFDYWRLGDDVVLDAGDFLKVNLNAGTVENFPYGRSLVIGANDARLVLKDDEQLVSFDVARNEEVWKQPVPAFFLSLPTDPKTISGNIYFSGGESSLYALELRSVSPDGTVQQVASLELEQGTDPQITRDGVVFVPAGKPNVGGLSGNTVAWTRYVDGPSLVHERGVTFLVEQRRWRFWLGRP
jgi:outer membrane protein assembly factor BamB